jgi:sulfur relay (sulfurtransferase) complex TusBCD TusD component (DsrE family)
MNLFLFFSSKSLNVNAITITDKIHQTLFKKKACVAELKKYQIQVKICQLSIHQRGNISQALARS